MGILLLSVLTTTVARADNVSGTKYQLGNIKVVRCGAESCKICLLSNGVWYGVTFGTVGLWTTTSDGKRFIFGDYSFGVGHDSIVVNPRLPRADWTEWTESFSHFVTISSIGFKEYGDCSPDASSGTKMKGNPITEHAN